MLTFAGDGGTTEFNAAVLWCGGKETRRHRPASGPIIHSFGLSISTVTGFSDGSDPIMISLRFLTASAPYSPFGGTRSIADFVAIAIRSSEKFGYRPLM